MYRRGIWSGACKGSGREPKWEHFVARIGCLKQMCTLCPPARPNKVCGRPHTAADCVSGKGKCCVRNKTDLFAAIFYTA